MTESEKASHVSLKEWVHKVYVRSNIAQLILVNVLFLLLLLGTFFLLGLNQHSVARKDAEQQLIGALQSKTDWVNAQLSSVRSQLQVLQRQTSRMLASDGQGDQSTPLALTDNDVLMKPEDDGGVAVYYSSQSSAPDEREAKARKLLPLNYLFADLQQANQLVRQVYLNTPDNLNLLYPYQDVDAQFAPDLDLTEFSFYYLADAAHNPQREPVWTDAYLDPAGLGWIISHIAPVYDGDSLEAVVGLDLTVENLINNLFSLPQPWSGYAVLVGKDGNILALPPDGEEDFGLQELTDGQYSFRHITTNTFKPELFNLYKRPEMSELSRLVAHQQAGLAQIDLTEPSVVAWNTVPLTGWKLLAVTSQHELYAGSKNFTRYLQDIGLLVLLLLVALFALHLGVHKARSRRLFLQIQEPVEHFTDLTRQALSGDVGPRHQFFSPIKEVQQISDHLHALVSEKARLAGLLEEYKASCQQQNDYFRNLLNSIPVPLFDTDAEYRIQGCNRAFEVFFAKQESELKGHLLTEFIPVTPPAEGALSEELMLTRAKESSLPVRLMITRMAEPVRQRDIRREKRLIGLIIDQSEQYQSREQVQFDRDRALEASHLQTEYIEAMRDALAEALQQLSELNARLEKQPENHQQLSRLMHEQIANLELLTSDQWQTDETRPSLGDHRVSERPVMTLAQVLVVDDGPVNTMLARSALQKVGYDVDVVNSGAQALQLMNQKQYQVVLMDIFMPDMDGIETTIHWREAEQAMQRQPAAIIALTANVLESERQRFFDAGMNEYLAKPYHPSELSALVDYWRQQYEAGQIPV